MSCELRPALVHASSRCLGHLDLRGGVVTDVLGGTLRVSCEACGESGSLSKTLGRDARTEGHCFACHAQWVVQARVGTEFLSGPTLQDGARSDRAEDGDDETEALLRQLRKKAKSDPKQLA